MTLDHSDLDALIADLAESEGERTLMHRAADLLAHVPLETEPPAGMRGRILGRVAAEKRGPQFVDGHSFFAQADAIPWITLAPGIRAKILWRDAATGAQTAILEMGPNLPFPAHHHDSIEDLYVVQGDAWVGDIPMRTGDYCRAPKDTDHNDVRSGPSGAVAFVVSR